MKDWLSQQSTKLGFALVVITVLSVLAQHGIIGAEWPAMASAIAAMLGLAVNDKDVKAPKESDGTSQGTKMLSIFAVLTISFSMIGFMSCASVPISPAVSKSAATVGCIAMEASGCFDDVQDAFPGINASTCSSVVGDAIEVAVEVQGYFAKMPREDAAAKSIEPLFRLTDRVDAKNWDPLKVAPSKLSPNSTCREAAGALGVK